MFCSFATISNAEATFKLCQDIVEHCNSSSAFEIGICVGYLEGVADKGDVGICIPDQTTPKQLSVQFVNWAQTHPRQNFSDASVCVTAAMIEGFPCR